MVWMKNVFVYHFVVSKHKVAQKVHNLRISLQGKALSFIPVEGDGVFVIKIKTLKFYAHTFLSYNDKAGGKGSNIIGRCYLVSITK